MIDEAVVEGLSAQVSVTGSSLNSKTPSSIIKTFKIEDENVTLTADLPIETIGDSGTLVTDTGCVHA